jgi:hypothetical protein
MSRYTLLVVGVGILLLGAGCGGKTTYSVDRTRNCLVQRGVRIGGKPNFVATTATGGAFVAHLGPNFVAVAFGTDLTTAEDIEAAYLRLALPNVRAGIGDVLRRYGNAVTLWHVHPADSDLALIVGCLS